MAAAEGNRVPRAAATDRAKESRGCRNSPLGVVEGERLESGVLQEARQVRQVQQIVVAPANRSSTISVSQQRRTLHVLQVVVAPAATLASKP